MNRNDDSTARQGLGSLFRLASLLGMALLLGGCATGTASGPGGMTVTDAERLERFRAAAGEPVPSFRLLRALDSLPLGDHHLAVWTRRNEAWLLRVEEPCMELPWQMQLGISSSLGRVYSGIDRVVSGGSRCRIREIRPVDLARLDDTPPQTRGTLEVRVRDDGGAGEGAAQGAGGT